MRFADSDTRDCPLCGADSRPAFAKNGYTVADCGACGHRFCASPLDEAHLATVYDDSYFFGGGDGYDDYLVEADLLRAQGVRYGQLLAGIVGSGRLLDVGCAAGFLQAGMAQAGWTTTGLEPNATMVNHARSRLGLDVMQGTLESPPSLEPFDAVTLIQVIGHFFDLSRALSSVRELTRAGGVCLIEYWRRESTLARAFGTRWHEYSPPSVLHWFTRTSLDAAMAARGFVPIAHGAPKKYISGGHARSLLEHKFAELPAGRVLAAPLSLVPKTLRIRYPSLDLEWRAYRREGDPAG